MHERKGTGITKTGKQGKTGRVGEGKTFAKRAANMTNERRIAETDVPGKTLPKRGRMRTRLSRAKAGSTLTIH